MTEVKRFTGTDFEFNEIARLYNLVSHDYTEHPDDLKDAWAIRDKSLIRDRLILFQDEKAIGYVGYCQGRDENSKNCYFNIFLDPNYIENGYHQLLYDKMLQEVQVFNCQRLYMSIFEHPNYDESKKFLVKNEFINNFKIRESSLYISSVDLDEYSSLIEKIDSKGIQFYDAKNEMKDF